MPQDVAADEEDPGAPDKHQEAKEEAAGQDLHEAANLFYTFLKTFFLFSNTVGKYQVDQLWSERHRPLPGERGGDEAGQVGNAKDESKLLKRKIMA